MRITESSMIDHMRQNMQASADNYQTNLDELSSGKKIRNPSDDPVGASKALAVRSMIDDMDHYLRNCQSAKSLLEYADGQLNSVTGLIDQARQIAVAAASSGTMQDDSAATYIAQIDSIIHEITQLANSDMDGRNVFSGTQTRTEPFSQDDPLHTYRGDDGPITATIAPNVNIRLNSSGENTFRPIFNALESLKKDLQNGDYTSISTKDIGAVDAGLEAVSLARASIGNRINEVTDTTNRVQTSQLHLQDQLSSIEDTDLATTYTQLQLAQNVYQASLASTSKGLQHSLIDYLR
jgi:flagellar hook-associated protein 3 FlgL